MYLTAELIIYKLSEPQIPLQDWLMHEWEKMT